MSLSLSLGRYFTNHVRFLHSPGHLVNKTFLSKKKKASQIDNIFFIPCLMGSLGKDLI